MIKSDKPEGSFAQRGDILSQVFQDRDEQILRQYLLALYLVTARKCVGMPSHLRRTYWYEYSVAPIIGGISFPYPQKAEERPRYLSMRESRMLVAMVLGWASFNLKTLSTTDSSVLVVSRPQKAHQSFTTIPAAITSLPRFTVPACQVMAQCGS